MQAEFLTSTFFLDEHEENALFDEINSATRLESIGKGRKGGIVVDASIRSSDFDQNCTVLSVPIIRTTASYARPAQMFAPVHRNITHLVAKKMNKKECKPFNNVMVEVYEDTYSRMGFHSDQALDIAPGSFIAIMSLYQDPKRPQRRKLIVKNKSTGKEEHVPLHHGSVVVFSEEANRRFLHKIVLDTRHHTSNTENRWLGVTMRSSKTFVEFDLSPSCQKVSELRLADDHERNEFLGYRRQENISQESAERVYPDHVPYTLSPSDVMLPTDN